MPALSLDLRDDSDMTSEEFTNGHPALAQFWHPVALSSEVGREPAAARLGGRGWALARFGGGIAAFADACPHRRARLSRSHKSLLPGEFSCRWVVRGQIAEVPRHRVCLDGD